jgi:4-hydroxythreonine-4-phosphate dehydrogenase
MTLPKIGITLGDPGGIGPEIILKAFSSLNTLPKANYIFFGSSIIIEQEKKALGLDLDIQPFERAKEADSSSCLFEIETPLKTVKKGAAYKENGISSFSFLKEAAEEAKKGTIQALVTGPISKYSWKLAGLKWKGHTDFFSRIYPQAIMAFWSDRMKTALFSHHLPLKEALKRVKREKLKDFFLRLHHCLEKIQPETFRFLVAGLNPHAGENGLLGSEEDKEIVPAIKEAQKQGMKISGPFPPDVVFRNALNRTETVVIALYHDQGLIPFKLEAFEKGVNITLGLPFIRTSPVHGTAFDIAGKGIASSQSMVEAIRLAYRLSQPLFQLSP